LLAKLLDRLLVQAGEQAHQLLVLLDRFLIIIITGRVLEADFIGADVA